MKKFIFFYNVRIYTKEVAATSKYYNNIPDCSKVKVLGQRSPFLGIEKFSPIHLARYFVPNPDQDTAFGISTRSSNTSTSII
jgi:hypothetical protein